MGFARSAISRCVCAMATDAGSDTVACAYAPDGARLIRTLDTDITLFIGDDLEHSSHGRLGSPRSTGARRRLGRPPAMARNRVDLPQPEGPLDVRNTQFPLFGVAMVSCTHTVIGPGSRLAQAK